MPKGSGRAGTQTQGSFPFFSTNLASLKGLDDGKTRTSLSHRKHVYIQKPKSLTAHRACNGPFLQFLALTHLISYQTLVKYKTRRTDSELLVDHQLTHRCYQVFI